ncbi:MAG: DUF3795 domain-containing protein [Deltaproteobacteria bacterium]|nr:DUF3795 domain-containing protein [Deltaproteobacteria bacterium]
MKVDEALLGPCGLYCGVCAIYIAHRDNNLKLKERLVILYKGGIPGKGVLPGSEDLTVEDIRCDGCLSDDVFIYCRRCDIKSCTEEKGLAGCHQCGEFPCRSVTEDFPMAVGKKVILRAVPHLRKVGRERFIVDEEARYICPECGNRVFRGAMKCNRCKIALDLD